MPKETMTPRERWLAILERRIPDRVPMDYWATAEASEKLMRHLGLNTLDEIYLHLHIDVPVKIFPHYSGPALPHNTDIFGIHYSEVSHDGGTYRETANNPLAAYTSVEEMADNYIWPTADLYDFTSILEQVKGQEHRPIQGGGSEPFLCYKNLRGQEQAFMDLIDNPEIVHYCLDKICGLYYEISRRIYETIPGQVTISFVAEDLGGQETLMYSPDHIREFMLPRMKSMMDLVHEAGAYVFHHDDGNCRAILPDMIEAGINVLNPVQWRCQGMDREGLKRDFGDSIIFHGAVDNQITLPFGSKEDVQQEVLDNLRILGAGGGYILAPCHNLQVVGPAENIVAMYNTGYEYGWC